MKKQIISTESLLQESKDFTPWSALYLVRIFKKDGENLFPLGSGGLLKYRNKYFVLTNYHVIKSVENINEEVVVPYTVRTEEYCQSYMMQIINHKYLKYDDIAVLEIQFSTNINLSQHRFLDEKFLDLNIEDYAAKNNILFLHGYPSVNTKIDDEKKEIVAETFPYYTFIDKYDTYIESIFAYIDEKGTSELNETVKIPDVYGMSGSFVYGYYLESPKFKLVGVLTSWDKNGNRLEVYPIREFIKFINECFFDLN